MNSVFIIDTYNPYSPYNDNVYFKFKINGNEFAIKQVNLEWGLPLLPISFDENAGEPQDFYLFNTFEEAKQYVDTLRRINR